MMVLFIYRPVHLAMYSVYVEQSTNIISHFVASYHYVIVFRNRIILKRVWLILVRNTCCLSKRLILKYHIYICIYIYIINDLMLPNSVGLFCSRNYTDFVHSSFHWWEVIFVCFCHNSARDASTYIYRVHPSIAIHFCQCDPFNAFNLCKLY